MGVGRHAARTQRAPEGRQSDPCLKNVERFHNRKREGQRVNLQPGFLCFHLFKILFFPLVDFKRNVSLLDIFSHFSRGLNQMEICKWVFPKLSLGSTRESPPVFAEENIKSLQEHHAKQDQELESTLTELSKTTSSL